MAQTPNPPVAASRLLHSRTDCASSASATGGYDGALYTRDHRPGFPAGGVGCVMKLRLLTFEYSHTRAAMMLITRCVPGSLSNRKQEPTRASHRGRLDSASKVCQIKRKMHCTLETQRVPLGESVRCFGKTAVLRRAVPVRRQVRRCFGAPKRKSSSGSAASCFGAELWFGMPNRRRTRLERAENLTSECLAANIGQPTRMSAQQPNYIPEGHSKPLGLELLSQAVLCNQF